VEALSADSACVTDRLPDYTWGCNRKSHSTISVAKKIIWPGGKSRIFLAIVERASRDNRFVATASVFGRSHFCNLYRGARQFVRRMRT